jgi:hypothetical protein
MAHFIALTTKLSMDETAELLIHHVFKLHGTHQEIVLDCRSWFISLL